MQGRDDYFSYGLTVSLVGHLCMAGFAYFGLLEGFGPFPEPVVYSVSIEGGATLGETTQLAQTDKKTDVAPLKNVSASEPPPEPINPDLKVVKPEVEEPAEDAEVSLAKETPKPQPTPKPTQAVKPTEAPKPTAKPKATAPAKPTSKPTSKPTAVKAQKNPQADVDKRLEQALQRYLGESSDAGGKGFGAAKVGGKGMGGGVVRPPEFFVYEKLLRSRIKDAWRWYDTNAPLITQIAFRIAPNGVVSDIQIVKSSGNSEFDESVERAVKKASPLPAPPASVYEQYFKHVRITFDPRE